MNSTIMRINIRENRLFFIIFVAILMMYASIISSMYDPVTIESMYGMLESMPGFASAVGFNVIPTDLVSFFGNYLFQFIFIIFPMIYIVILGNRLVARHVDKGSLASFLSTPLKRGTFILTQAITMIFSTIALMLIAWITLLLISKRMYPNQLDVEPFLMLCAGAILLLLFLGAISFFFSTLCSETKTSLTFGAGIPIVFFLMDMIGRVGDKFSFFTKLTPFGLFSISSILAGESQTVPFIILGGGTILLYVLSFIIFKRKNLVM